ncbi:hypothetical protein GEMRC1_009698 [Eukaryota sp. GEM-RC1]
MSPYGSPCKKYRSFEDPSTTLLNDQRPEADSPVDPSPNAIVLQESLLVSINLHVLRRVCASEFEKGVSYSFQQSFHRVNRMSEFIQNIGYVSNLFFKTACFAVQVFLATHLFKVRRPENVPKLANIASFFNSELHSIDLEVWEQFPSTNLVPFTPIIHNICLACPFPHSNDFFDPQSPLFLPNISQLSLGRMCLGTPNITFDDVTAQFILESLTIEALDVLLSTPTQAELLTKIFSSAKCRLRKLLVDSSEVPELDNQCFISMIVSLANCKSMQEVNLSCTFMTFDIFAPLFSSSSIRKLILPFKEDKFCVLKSLEQNSALQELKLRGFFDATEICNVLKHSTVLKRLEMTLTELSFSPIFKSLESNFSLKELIVCANFSGRDSLENEEVEALCELLQQNNSLIIIYFGGHETSLMNSTQFSLFVDALKNNPIIRKVSLPCSSPSLSSFVSNCETVCVKQLPFSVDFDPHFIDYIKKVFCFSPKSSSRITTLEVSSLQSFVERFSIKELTLKNCIFTDDTVIVLSNLIRNNNSLTSVEFSHDKISNRFRSSSYHHGRSSRYYTPPPTQSDDVTLQLIIAIQSNSRLNRINLNNNFIGLNSLCTIFEMVSVGKLIPLIQISPHSFNTSTGSICYEKRLIILNCHHF